jgi:hypothetical protein
MRFPLKVELPVEIANAVTKKGSLEKTIRSILDEQKPEAVYFLASNGKRTAFLFVEIEDASQIPALAEPWFHAFQASIEIVPVMTPDDLKKASPALRRPSRNMDGVPCPTNPPLSTASRSLDCSPTVPLYG